MKPVEGRNDFIFFRTNGVVGIATHKFEAGFVRFCSGWQKTRSAKVASQSLRAKRIAGSLV